MDVVFSLLLTRDGRIGRLIFLVSSLVWSIVGGLIVEIVMFALMMFVVGIMAVSGPFGALVGILAFVAFLAMLVGYAWISLNLMVKRLHDFNWSGSIAVLAVILQVIVFGLLVSRDVTAVGIGALGLMVLLVFWLALLVVPGTPGVNDYGDRMRVRIE